MNGAENAQPLPDLPAIGMTTYPISKGKYEMTDILSANTRSSDAPSVGAWSQWLTRRRMAFAAAATVLGSGMTLNWGWLSAVGLAPILISLAPCAAMCGLGLCMKGGPGTGCSKASGTMNGNMMPLDKSEG